MDDKKTEVDVYNCSGLEGLGDFSYPFLFSTHARPTAAPLQSITGSSA